MPGPRAGFHVKATVPYELSLGLIIGNGAADPTIFTSSKAAANIESVTRSGVGVYTVTWSGRGGFNLFFPELQLSSQNLGIGLQIDSLSHGTRTFKIRSFTTSTGAAYELTSSDSVFIKVWGLSSSAK